MCFYWTLLVLNVLNNAGFSVFTMFADVLIAFNCFSLVYLIDHHNNTDNNSQTLSVCVKGFCLFYLFIFYCFAQKWFCCLWSDAEMGCWIKVRACTFVMYVFTCLYAASVEVKSHGSFNPWLACLLGNSWSQALCHATTTPPTVLTKEALSCNRGNLSTSLLWSCCLWNTMWAIW